MDRKNSAFEENIMRKNLFIILTLLAAVGLLLSACGTQSTFDDIQAGLEAESPSSTEAPAEGAEAPAAIGVEPMEGAVPLTDATTEASAREMAGLMQITESISWEGWELPADTTWDTVVGYYDDKASAAGWSSDAGSVKDIGGNKVAVFGKGDGSRLAIIYLPQSDMVQVLAVAGK
jgi:hypothetical protein